MVCILVPVLVVVVAMDDDMAKRRPDVESLGAKAQVDVGIDEKMNGERERTAGKIRRHLESIVYF